MKAVSLLNEHVLHMFLKLIRIGMVSGGAYDHENGYKHAVYHYLQLLYTESVFYWQLNYFWVENQVELFWLNNGKSISIFQITV